MPLLQSLASELVMLHLSFPSLLAVAAAAAKQLPRDDELASVIRANKDHASAVSNRPANSS